MLLPFHYLAAAAPPFLRSHGLIFRAFLSHKRTTGQGIAQRIFVELSARGFDVPHDLAEGLPSGVDEPGLGLERVLRDQAGGEPVAALGFEEGVDRRRHLGQPRLRPPQRRGGVPLQGRVSTDRRLGDGSVERDRSWLS